jgi:hypothetical protein
MEQGGTDRLVCKKRQKRNSGKRSCMGEPWTNPKLSIGQLAGAWSEERVSVLCCRTSRELPRRPKKASCLEDLSILAATSKAFLPSNQPEPRDFNFPLFQFRIGAHFQNRWITKRSDRTQLRTAASSLRISAVRPKCRRVNDVQDSLEFLEHVKLFC